MAQQDDVTSIRSCTRAFKERQRWRVDRLLAQTKGECLRRHDALGRGVEKWRSRFRTQRALTFLVASTFAGLSHLRESVTLHEESQRLQRMCRELKKRDHLTAFLRRAHDAAHDLFTRAHGSDDFAEALDPPRISGRPRSSPSRVRPAHVNGGPSVRDRQT